MPTGRSRAIGLLAFICLFGLLGFAGWSADKCRRTQNCGGYSRPAKGPPDQKHEESLWDKTTSDPTALYTLLLAIFTAALAGASIFQGYFLIRADRTARTTADAALAAANAAKTQAGHLESSVAESKRTADNMKLLAEATKTSADVAMLAQRARIQITPSWETDLPPNQYGRGMILPPPNYKFGSKMDNVGQMPTSNLKNRIDYILITGEISADFNFPDDEPHMAQAGVLGTKQFFLGPHIPRERYVSAAEMAQMQQGESNFYLFGWVKYSDGFTDTPERTTTFCYRVRVTGNPGTPVVFIPHEHHNHSD
jgi:hypothetical protein